MKTADRLRRRKRREILQDIVSISIVCLLVFFMIRAHVIENNIKEYGVETNGTVVDVSNNQRHTGSGVKYIFIVGNKEVKGATAYPEFTTSFCESLIGKSFPVKYNPKVLSQSTMILTGSRFKEYGMVQPDSLKWIDAYIR